MGCSGLLWAALACSVLFCAALCCSGLLCAALGWLWAAPGCTGLLWAAPGQRLHSQLIKPATKIHYILYTFIHYTLDNIQYYTIARGARQRAPVLERKTPHTRIASQSVDSASSKRVRDNARPYSRCIHISYPSKRRYSVCCILSACFYRTRIQQLSCSALLGAALRCYELL